MAIALPALVAEGISNIASLTLHIMHGVFSMIALNPRRQKQKVQWLKLFDNPVMVLGACERPQY